MLRDIKVRGEGHRDKRYEGAGHNGKATVIRAHGVKSLEVSARGKNHGRKSQRDEVKSHTEKLYLRKKSGWPRKCISGSER